MHCYFVFQHFLNAITLRKLFYAIVFILLYGCALSKPYHAKGPGWYMVKPTDTLYSISWRYGLDYNDLARWNGLNDDYLIYPGQQLILIEPDKIPDQRVATASSDNQNRQTQSNKSVKVTPLPDPKKIARNPVVDNNKKIKWIWPTKGKVDSLFSLKDLDRRGIDIAGKIGQPVYAVAAGKVVYSGTGLAGYGNLIIIKHNDIFLSAYAFNRNRLVAEGTQVKQGGVIAEMGQNKDKKPILHFQIRKKGKPVDPLRYLPKQ
jgi:lipoprotein NlpD